MNKRIKELAKLAGLDNDMCPLDTWDNPELEKFAELIVRECLIVINQSNGVGDDDVIKISMDVKEHFGVTE